MGEKRKASRPFPANPMQIRPPVLFALAAGAATAAVLSLATPSRASDAELLAAVRSLVTPVEVAASVAAGGDPNAVQSHYDSARNLDEALREAEPVSRSCRTLLKQARLLASGHILQAEGFDLPRPALVQRGRKRAANAKAKLASAQANCRPASAQPIRTATTLRSPRPGEAIFGVFSDTGPSNATRAEVVVNGSPAGDLTTRNGQVRGSLSGQPGRYKLGVRYYQGARRIKENTSKGVWVLPRTGARAKPAKTTDQVLAGRLAQLGRSFNGAAGIWIHDLSTGTTAGWSETVRFPAASTVKLAVMIAALQRAGNDPLNSAFAYDLRTIGTWSSNIANNRLLTQIGRTSAGGAAIAQSVLRRLGANSSTFTGGYRAGTSSTGSRVPPAISSRVTTARDLGLILFRIHAAAAGKRGALRKTGLTRHQARVLLGLLLGSKPIKDNVGLFAPSLNKATTIAAQKHGWFSSVRHSAAIIYTQSGPKIVVVLTYRSALPLRDAQALGRQVIDLAS